METLELKAPDISCGHCVSTIREAVTLLDGVEFVDADIPAGKVRLRHEPGRTSKSEIGRAMAGAGYPVKG